MSHWSRASSTATLLVAFQVAVGWLSARSPTVSGLITLELVLLLYLRDQTSRSRVIEAEVRSAA